MTIKIFIFNQDDGDMASRRHLSPARALNAPMKDIEEEMLLLKEERKMIVNDPNLLEHAVNDCYDDLLESVIMGFSFELHRAHKTGMYELEKGVQRNVNQVIVDEPGLDIFGQPPLKKPPDCTCPECNRSLTAARFAPHLEKCMGMGRNSSRIAQRRIANNSNSGSNNTNVTEDADDVDDADWTVGSVKRRKKKERAPGKRVKSTKLPRNGNVSHAEGAAPASVIGDISVSYEDMNFEERKNLLVQICGVISKHTHRLCIRSLQCPQHTDEQRRAVRTNLLNSEAAAEGSISFEQVDVDTYEEGDGQNMRDQLGRSWEQEHSNTNSPADSCSTGSSTQSKKREKVKIKKKSSKKVSHNPYGE